MSSLSELERKVMLNVIPTLKDTKCVQLVLEAEFKRRNKNEDDDYHLHRLYKEILLTRLIESLVKVFFFGRLSSDVIDYPKVNKELENYLKAQLSENWTSGCPIMNALKK